MRRLSPPDSARYLSGSREIPANLGFQHCPKIIRLRPRSKNAITRYRTAKKYGVEDGPAQGGPTGCAPAREKHRDFTLPNQAYAGCCAFQHAPRHHQASRPRPRQGMPGVLGVLCGQGARPGICALQPLTAASRLRTATARRSSRPKPLGIETDKVRAVGAIHSFVGAETLEQARECGGSDRA